MTPREIKIARLIENGIPTIGICVRLQVAHRAVEAVRARLAKDGEPQRHRDTEIDRDTEIAGGESRALCVTDALPGREVAEGAEDPAMGPARPNANGGDEHSDQTAAPIKIAPPHPSGPAAGPSEPSPAEVRPGGGMTRAASRATPRSSDADEAAELRAVAARHGVPIGSVLGILAAARGLQP